MPKRGSETAIEHGRPVTSASGEGVARRFGSAPMLLFFRVIVLKKSQVASVKC